MEANNNNQDSDFGFGFGLACFQPFPPSFSPSPRRLSSQFTAPNKPIKAQKQLSLISLQGRLVGAEEATAARAIGGLVGPQEAVAWDLFSPVQRVLVVAVIAVAVTNSKKNKQIFELKKSVELRDLVLAAMQEELDSLCEQVNYFKDQPDTMCKLSSTKNGDFSPAKSFTGDINYLCCGCQPCHYHQYSINDPMGSAYGKSTDGDLFNYQLPFMNVAEPEERRMSNLSDWAPSVISSLDFQLQLDNEQDIYNLRKECEEKDTTIKELSTVIETSEAISSKRIAELEDIIRRKNTIITKLKKDMMILEQKVMNLSRLRRPSFTSSGSAPSPSPRKLPLLTDNLIYDMDSTTSPSSSDSDCPPNESEATVAESQKIPVQSNISTGDQKLSYAKICNLVVKSSEAHQRIRPVSPLKEKSLNQKSEPESFPKPKQPLSSGGNLKTRRRPPTRSKDGTLQKKWT